MRPVRKVLLVILGLFLLPLGLHAALYASKRCRNAVTGYVRPALAAAS